MHVLVGHITNGNPPYIYRVGIPRGLASTALAQNHSTVITEHTHVQAIKYAFIVQNVPAYRTFFR